MARILLAGLLLAGCGIGLDQTSGNTAPDAGPPTASESAWLDPHNAVRAQAQPAPSPALPALTWSDGAAAVAQAWADNCVYQHNANRGTRGENIAATSPAGNRNAAAVVGLWAGEVSDYNYAANSCAAGKECGHYTQIVWRGTTRV